MERLNYRGYEDIGQRLSDSGVAYACQCRCVCRNERLDNQRVCDYCFLEDHEGTWLIGPPKPSRFAEQRAYSFNGGSCEIR